METLSAFTDPVLWSQAWELLVKLSIAVVLAGAIGWEREHQGRPAGIRTHMLMAVGVVLFAEASRAFAPNDPARIASQIVTGVGFIGAGAIMRMGIEVRGLTTASAVWAAAAIGLAVSAGGAMLLIAVLATALALITLIVVDRFEAKLFHRLAFAMVVSLDGPSTIGALLDACNESPSKLADARREPEGTWSATLTFATRDDALLAKIVEIEGVRQAYWSD